MNIAIIFHQNSDIAKFISFANGKSKMSKKTMKIELLNMLDTASEELKKIDFESTCPVEPHLFHVLSNFSVALDIFSVNIVRDDPHQFSHDQKDDLKLRKTFFEAFMELHNTCFTIIFPNDPDRITNYVRWHLWALYQTRGVCGVTLLRDDNNSLLLTPRDELQQYISDARNLVNSANL